MKLFTSFAKRAMTIVAAFGVAALMFDASAQYKSYAFVVDGIVYKTGTTQAKELELTCQKATYSTNLDANSPAVPGTYAGDLVIPYNVTYNGKEYTVVKIGTVFSKSTEITSITLGEGHKEVGRAAFQNNTAMTKVQLPSTVASFGLSAFAGCTALEEINIPAGMTEVKDKPFSGCNNITKLTIDAAETPITITMSNAFVDAAGVNCLANLKELVLNRQTTSTSVAEAPFRNLKNLETVTIGGNMTSFGASYFQHNAAMKNVTFNVQPTSFGTAVFENCGLVEFNYPASLTSVSASCFAGCKNLTNIVLPEGLTTIEPMAFQNTALASVAFPSTLTSIGQMAFSGSKFAGELAFPEGFKSVGIQAFANTAITKVSFPASATTIGDGAFLGCTSIASYVVDAANETLKTDAAQSYVYSSAETGKTLHCFAPASAVESISEAFNVIAPYACYKAGNLKSIDFGASCNNWGDYSLAETGISTLKVQGVIGRYVAKGSAIESLIVDYAEAPFGIAMDCKNLKSVEFLKGITIVKQDAFNGCSVLETLNLGALVAILEADCFANSGIKTLNVSAAIPAGMAEGVFVEGCGMTANVPVDYVADYQAADGWKYLTIVGDANIVAGPTDMGMPAGIYYAAEDGNIYGAYADGGTKLFEVGGAPHTFQLIEYKNRIYGASAGEKFFYSGTNATEGDGKLFYLSQVGGTLFQAVVLDNYGLNAYKDPFGLYIYGEDLYVNDRNVCIRKIPASGIALNAATFPSWIENNWMGWYDDGWSYGCIKSGWAVTTGVVEEKDADGNVVGTKEVPEYWLGIKYNGNGIYRFRDEHVGTGTGTLKGTKPTDGDFLVACGPVFTTFYIDEANQHMYIYIEKAGSTEESQTRAGLYRVDMAKLLANPNPFSFSDLEPLLIDGSPVKYEGSGTNEHVGISQLSPDAKGEYLYWCYRAPTASEAATHEAQDFDAQNKGRYWWADKFDETNPLHQSGIKRIKLGEANPVVEMVVPGVNGYGIVPVNYEGSTTPDLSVETLVSDNANEALVVNGDEVVVLADAVVSVYALNGTMVSYQSVVAGQTVSVAEFPAGAYIVSAVLANGKKAVAKVVK